MRYWLMKSEPSTFSIDDLRTKNIEPWDGVRNYQARNMLRDDMRVGDQAFFYHSNCAVPGIVGSMRIVKTGYPDSTAFDPNSKYYDPSSSPAKPRWYRVDVQFKQKFSKVISLEQIKQHPLLQQMLVARKGNRLSVTPVTAEEWEIVLTLAKE
jgi:predicted RNA-binding protein with PUA-like domain